MEPDDDRRLDLAAGLVPGTTMTLFRGDGPLVTVGITAVRGVDVVGAVDPAVALGPADLLTARLLGEDAAWFATFVVRGLERRGEGPAVVELRLGEAVPVTTGRWSERVVFRCSALVRDEGGAGVLRGTVVDLSRTGVGLQLHGDALPLDARVGVTLEGDGRGTIAFRGAAVRLAPAPGGQLIGVEILGISRADAGRLARLLHRHADEPTASTAPP